MVPDLLTQVAQLLNERFGAVDNPFGKIAQLHGILLWVMGSILPG